MAWGVGDIVGAEVRLGNGVEVAVGELSNAFSSVGSGSGVGLSDGSGAPIVGVIVGAAVSGVGVELGVTRAGIEVGPGERVSFLWGLFRKAIVGLSWISE